MCVSTCGTSQANREHKPSKILQSASGFNNTNHDWVKQKSSQVHLTDIIKVSMWDFLLCCQLFHLIEQDVHLEFGAEVLQTSIAEGLSVAKPKERQMMDSFCDSLKINFC